LKILTFGDSLGNVYLSDTRIRNDIFGTFSFHNDEIISLKFN